VCVCVCVCVCTRMWSAHNTVTRAACASLPGLLIMLQSHKHQSVDARWSFTLCGCWSKVAVPACAHHVTHRIVMSGYVMVATALQLHTLCDASLSSQACYRGGSGVLWAGAIHLTSLDVSAARLRSLSSVCHLRNLQALHVSHNAQPLLGLAGSELAALTALRVLELDDAKLPLGCLPSDVGLLTGLRELLVTRCKLWTLPPEVAQCTALEVGSRRRRRAMLLATVA